MKSQNSRATAAQHCVYCDALLPPGTSEAPLFPRSMRARFTIDGRFVRSTVNDLHHARLNIPVCKSCNAAGNKMFDDAFVASLLDEPLSAVRKKTLPVVTLAARFIKGFAHLDRETAHGKKASPEKLVQALAASPATGARFQDGRKSWTPGSVLVFDLYSPERRVDQFDFHYDPVGAVSMRLGPRGFVVIVDGGFLQEDHGAFFLRQARLSLHPIQFQEMGAVAFYRSSLMKGRCKSKTMADKGGQPIVSKDENSPRVWNSWKQRRFAPVLAAFTKYPTDVLNPGGGDAIMTWMFDGQGGPLKIDFKKLPFFRDP